MEDKVKKKMDEDLKKMEDDQKKWKTTFEKNQPKST